MWTHPVLTSRARGPLSFSMQMKLPGRKFELPALYAQRKTGYDGTSGGDNRDAKRQNSFFVMQEFLENEEDIDKSSSQQVNIRPEIRKLKVGKKTFKRRTGTITIKRQAPTLSQRAKKMIKDSTVGLAARLNIVTLLRVGLPSVVAAVLGYAYFDNISLFLFHNWLSATEIQFLSSDEVQFIPSFLQVLGLLFSILAGNAYSVLYNQQETIYLALFQEVSEAKSLLEQTALICQGRPFYPAVLKQIKLYIRNDLRRLDVPPVELIAQSPSRDPLEKIMFMTSVGVPSVIYETVKNLRQARGERLGACQRKFPRLGIILLYILAFLELAAFPLLGAGTIAGLGVKMDPTRVFGLQSILFAGLTGATVLVLRIIEELWQQSGGSFNVDATLARMVQGLESELDERTKNIVKFKANDGDDDVPRMY